MFLGTTMCASYTAAIRNENKHINEYSTQPDSGDNTYYANFTKYVLQSQSENEVTSSYSYEDWKANPNSLESLKIPELKYLLKSCNLRVSGKKDELISRLHKHYSSISSVIFIQRVFRGFLVRESERMRGPGYPDRSRCLNETDFHTMDLLSHIPREEFFSYRDSAGFVYGFNVFSLMAMFKRNRKIVNPYNREDVPIPIVCHIFSLYKKILILYPLTCNLTRFNNVSSSDFEQIQNQDRNRREDENNDSAVTTSEDSAEEMDDMDAPSSATDNVVHSHTSIETRLSQLRQYYSYHERVAIVFERISELVGRVCDSQWFLRLNKTQYDRFYHYFFVWWSRSNTSQYKQYASHPLGNPFHAMPKIDESADEEHLRNICIELIERMVYSGVDEHCQRMGAKHALMILSIVSKPARNTFPDLFDTLC